MTTDKHPIIAAIKWRAIQRGLSQRKLEKMTGLRQSHISDIFNNTEDGNNPTLATLEKLARAVELDIIAVRAEDHVPVVPSCDYLLPAPVVPESFVVRVTYDENSKRTISIEES